ncbi:MAG TPA: TolC family protein [Pyrinomonadaceae bacterium]|jgi:HAE1 family hydrophobic/amphiphilic exporter-1|nr:TolC family protein [Pyrinomonadaceae bacterium]
MKTLRKNTVRALLTIALLCLASAWQLAGAQTTGAPSGGTTTTTTTTVAPAPSANTPVIQTTTPAPASGVTIAPSANTPQGQSPAPGSNARSLTTGAQTEQSAQPSTPQAGQQSGSQQPAAPAGPSTPTSQTGPTTSAIPMLDSLPSGSGSISAPTEQTQGPQTHTIPSPPGVVRAPGRESVPTPAPDALPSVPAVAPDYRAEPAPFPELGRVGVDMSDQRPLSLREALEMALANNKDIEVARTIVRAAEFDLQGARGVYDPRLSSLSYYERSETPSSSLLSGGSNGAVTQSDFTGTARFEGLSPVLGGGYRVDLSAIRLTTNNQFAAFNPQFPTALTFNYTQPLVRGLRFDQNRRQIEVAKKNLSLTDAQFRQRTIETIAAVQRAYWDLVFALRNLQVQRDAVRDARAQLEHNKRLVAEGILAPIDVVAADAQVSGYEQSVYSALEDVSRSENNLKNLIAENRESRFWNLSIIPTDPVDLEPPVVSLPDAMAAALANRPELKQSEVIAEINHVDQRYFREQTKPQIDLIGSYGMVGLAGSLSQTASGGNPLANSNADLRARINELSVLNGLAPLPPPAVQPIPEDLIGGFGQSFGSLAANRYSNFRVGVQVNLPLRNRTAEANLGRSLVEGRRIETQREQLEQLVQVDVRNALQVVRTAGSRLRAAAAARSASEQQYSSEQRRFDAGQSTLFLVLERQTALTTARGNELRAQTDLNKAIAELQRATGNSLQANNVVVQLR